MRDRVCPSPSAHLADVCWHRLVGIIQSGCFTTLYFTDGKTRRVSTASVAKLAASLRAEGAADNPLLVKMSLWRDLEEAFEVQPDWVDLSRGSVIRHLVISMGFSLYFSWVIGMRNWLTAGAGGAIAALLLYCAWTAFRLREERCQQRADRDGNGNRLYEHRVAKAAAQRKVGVRWVLTWLCSPLTVFLFLASAVDFRVQHCILLIFQLCAILGFARIEEWQETQRRLRSGQGANREMPSSTL